MLQSDIDYLSATLVESYGEYSTLKFIPVINAGKVDRYGESISTFDDEHAFKVYGIFAPETSKEIDLNTKDTQATHRLDGIIKLVSKTVRDNGYKVDIGYGIDVLNEYGTFDRYIITGFDKKVELPEVLTRVFVTKYSRLASK